MEPTEKTNNDNDANVVQPYARWVALPIRPEHVFHFPNGLPAFEEFKNYIFTFNEETSPFVYMNAIEPAGLSFVCINPFDVHPRYAPRLSDRDIEFLRVSTPEDVLLLSIVTVRPDVRETTANLQGPLAINIRASIGKQIMCEGQSYPVRYRIWDALEAKQDDQRVCLGQYDAVAL